MKYQSMSKPWPCSCPVVVSGTLLSLELGPMQIAQLVLLPQLEMEIL